LLKPSEYSEDRKKALKEIAEAEQTDIRKFIKKL
jgi:hypothetical protein